MKYIATSRFKLNSPIDANEVCVELSKMGNFTPEDVVSRAKDEKSPLHKYFEWDDSLAAHAHRLSQARNLVLAIGFENTDGQVSRKFESVVIDDQRVYAPIEAIAQSPDLIDQVLAAAMRELIFWKNKHQRYSDFFGGVFDEITRAEKAYRRLNEKDKGGKKRASGDKDNHSANKKANRKHNNHGRQPIAG